MTQGPGLMRCLPAWWESLVEWLQGTELPWPEEAAMLDLRWWSLSGELPSVVALQRRWQWGEHRTRELLVSTRWHDRSVAPPRRKRRIAAIRYGGIGTTRQTARDSRKP